MLAQLKRQGLDLSALDSVLTSLLPIKSYMHYLFTMCHALVHIHSYRLGARCARWLSAAAVAVGLVS